MSWEGDPGILTPQLETLNRAALTCSDPSEADGDKIKVNPAHYSSPMTLC